MTRFEFPNNIGVNYEVFHRSVYADYLRLLTSGGASVSPLSAFSRDAMGFIERFNSAARRQIDDYLAINTFGVSESTLTAIKATERLFLTRLDSLVTSTVSHYSNKLRIQALFGNGTGFTDREFDFRIRDVSGKMQDPHGYSLRAAGAFAVDVYFLNAVDALKRKGTLGKIIYPDVTHRNNGTVFDPNNAEQVSGVAAFFHPNTSAQVVQNAVSP